VEREVVVRFILEKSEEDAPVKGTQEAEKADVGLVAMLGRRLPLPLRKYGPYAVAFLFGYILKCLDTPTEHLSGLENDLPLFVGPSFSLLVLVISSPGNSAVRDVIRNTWLSVSKKNHNFKALFVIGNRNLNSKEEYEIATEKSRYDDILLLPIFDSYGTLTNKV
jgi:hypothetical protein